MTLFAWFYQCRLSLFLTGLAIGAAVMGSCHAQCREGFSCPTPRVPAPQVPHRPPPPFACRVIVETSSGVSYGSGVLVRVVDGKGYVLTCHHVVRGSARARVVFPGRETALANVIKTDSRHDLALLQIRRPHVQPANLADKPPKGLLVVGGFGGDGRYQSVRSPLVRYATPIGAQFPSLVIRGAVRRGDSGGPVINAAGRLVGIVWGVQGGESYVTFGSPVERLLQSLDRQKAPALVPVGPRPSQFPSQSACERRLDALEHRLQSMASCQCDGDCAGREELESLENRFSTRHQAALDRIAKLGDKAHSSTASITTLQVVLGALGVGGPAGLAIVAVSWLAKGRFSRRLNRRGRGGPRRETFRPADEFDQEPAA